MSHKQLTAQIVTTYLTHNAMATQDVPAFIIAVHTALIRAERSDDVDAAPPSPIPCVDIERSISDNYLISLETGKRLKSLKRHLRSLGMTPDDYRRKWCLPADYPMVAPALSRRRAEVAKQSFARLSDA